MAVYSVFEPPERGGDATEHAGEFVFVRDGFSFPAFLFGPLWMLWHRLWLVVIGYIIAVALLEIAIRLAGGGAGVESSAALLFAVLVGLEAASLQRWTLTWRAWRDRGIVVADDLEAAERRFFAAWVGSVGQQTSPPLPTPPRLRLPAGNDVIGLFPQPGANH
jgi:Protein of unknown function (DUF2628)